MIAQGDTREIPRCNVMLYRKDDSEHNEEEVSQDNVEVNSVKFQNEEESEEEGKEDNRQITRSIDKELRRELKLDNISTFWLKLKDGECYDEIS